MLEAAFRRTLATCKFWPVKIADVREHVERAEDSRAEDEWPNLLEYCRRHVNADLGMAHAPKLPPDISHAAAAAGGLYFLESCATDDLQWAKKRFVEDLTRQRKSGDIASLLGDSKLGKLLAEVAPRFSLPAMPPPALSGVPRTSEETALERAVLRRVTEAKPTPSPEPTEEELAANWQDQKVRARQWAIDHGVESELSEPRTGATG